MEILIGTVAGVVAAIVCTAFYTKGVRDGVRVRRIRRRKSRGEDDVVQEKDLVRKFDAILDYDPYSREQRDSMEGENV